MLQQVSPSPISMLILAADTARAGAWQGEMPARYDRPVIVRVAASLQDGLPQLFERRVDVVLLDLAAPDWRGTVRMLRLTAPRCAVVAVQTVEDHALFLDALRSGVHEVLALSSREADVPGTVDRALVRAGHGAEAPAAPDSQTSGLLRLIHDLNNVITAINGYADLLSTLTPPPDHVRRCAEEIKSAGIKAAGLVRSFAQSQPPRAPSSSPPLPAQASPVSGSAL